MSVGRDSYLDAETSIFQNRPTTMVDFRITETLQMHSQPPKSPNPPSPPYQGGNRYQGDFGNFARVGVIGRCLLISLIHYNSFGLRSLRFNWQLDWQFALSRLCSDYHIDGCGHGGVVDIVSGEGCGDTGAAPERIG